MPARVKRVDGFEVGLGQNEPDFLLEVRKLGIDPTGATATFSMYLFSDPWAVTPLVLSQAATIETVAGAVGGPYTADADSLYTFRLRYSWAADGSDTVTAGIYFGRIEVTFATGQTSLFPPGRGAVISIFP